MNRSDDIQYSNIEEQLQTQGVYISTTVGISMRPMLRNRRDRIVLLPIGTERLKKWDLPMYRRDDGKYVLHRIIAVRDGYYVIRGDNTYRKEYVRDSQILGYVSEFYRGNRHIFTHSKSYRIYAAIWQTVYPLRLPLHCAISFARRIKHKLKHLFKK